MEVSGDEGGAKKIPYAHFEWIPHNIHAVISLHFESQHTSLFIISPRACRLSSE